MKKLLSIVLAVLATTTVYAYPGSNPIGHAIQDIETKCRQESNDFYNEARVQCIEDFRNGKFFGSSGQRSRALTQCLNDSTIDRDRIYSQCFTRELRKLGGR